MIRTVLIALSVTFAAGLLFVNYYNSVVDAVNWNASIPNSIVAARSYYSAANPGTFFRLVSPINQVLAVIIVIASWKMGRARYFAIAALVMAVGADLLTFGYFYPRNEIMFAGPITNTDAIRHAASEWASMNWVRSGIAAIGVFFAMSTLILTTRKSAI